MTAGVCVIHLLRNTFRYASRKYWAEVSKDIKPVYTAPTEAAAKERFGEFAAKWGEQYPAIVRLWDNAWSEFVPFLDYGGCCRIDCCGGGLAGSMWRGQVLSSRAA
ncbi:Transposase and inactivated derivatives [Nocardia africana]|uniref:Mutator family transposase n=1 Tax=Nocardia africana TaxID=134964 RepID=A0A378X7F9_9NOCA|nr:Transposase and inactivated derivatives [Nocardia africana]